MFKAVIFDMDGLMVDSEPIHQQAFDIVFQKYGKRFSEEDNIKLYLGKTDKDCADGLFYLWFASSKEYEWPHY